MAESHYVADRVVNADHSTGRSQITVEDGLITSVTATAGAPHGVETIAVPGFIDMHTHGAVGHDVMDATTESLANIARHHLEHGTTGFLGSTVTAPLETLGEVLATAREFSRSNDEESREGRTSSLLGIHVEGPWISPERAGAQNPAHMSAPDAAGLDFVRNNADLIRMVTFSYHYPEADRLLDLCLRTGIIPACGHDQTVDERMLTGFARGLRHITHIYSMSSSFQRVDGVKHLGAVEMALMTPGVVVEVIADGKHITNHFWRFIRHNKEPKDIVIVSDSMRWAGMPDDPDRVHRLGDVDVIVDDGVAWISDRSAFAGSVSTMHAMFRRLVRDWDVPIEDAVRMTSANQAGELGLADSLGSIEPGKQADFVVLNKELEILQVVKHGVALR